MQLTTQTMSSREIAELLNIRHDSVKRTIIRLIEAESISNPPLVDGIKSANGVVPTHYEICKRDSYVIVAQLSPTFTAKLVDRWQELEAKELQPALPSNYIEALESLVAAEKEKACLSHQLQIAAPKVAFYDDVTNSDTTIKMAEAAKVLNIKGLGRNNLFKFLRDKSVLQHNNHPYQTYVDRGYFRIVESKKEDSKGVVNVYLTTVVYQKGLDFIRKLASKEA